MTLEFAKVSASKVHALTGRKLETHVRKASEYFRRRELERVPAPCEARCDIVRQRLKGWTTYNRICITWRVIFVRTKLTAISDTVNVSVRIRVFCIESNDLVVVN